MPLSGGKDSSYVLFYLVRGLGLKPLVAYFNSGFSTETSKRNVEKLCQKLSVELVIGNASKYRRKFVSESLKISKYKGRFGNTCANCENNLRSFVINEAIKRKIPFIIWGSTNFEELFSIFLSPNTPTFQEDFGRNIAYKTAKKAIRTKKPITLEPMSAYERRFIHLKLAEQPDIVTESIGEEPERKVVVRLYP